tara:strand:- start:56 stop:454 length:399 start_codon:yes stop_codon:yes gene_type:complete
MSKNLRRSSEEHQEFESVVKEYFKNQENNPDVGDDNVPTGKDGEPLSPKGRQLKQIFEEERLWHKDARWRAQNKLQDNFSWILDNQDEEEDAGDAYNTLLEVVENIATYHNEAGKKAERVLNILKDPTILDK